VGISLQQKRPAIGVTKAIGDDPNVEAEVTRGRRSPPGG